MVIYTSKHIIGETINDSQEFVDERELVVNFEHAGITHQVSIIKSTDDKTIEKMERKILEVINDTLNVSQVLFTRPDAFMFAIGEEEG